MNISKQAHWKFIIREQQKAQEAEILRRAMLELRQFHPKMGAKKMYLILKPKSVGRDKFISLYNSAGLRLERERSYRRTTFSNPSAKYGNLTINKVFNDMNQIWSSDITYLPIGADEFVYITFIMDVYSRYIIGYQVSSDLSAAASVKALKMAFKERGIRKYSALIHHSDKGTQYTSKLYTDLLEKYNVKISMCNSVYENTHIERVNGTIKNDYLAGYSIKSLADCQRTLKKVIPLYNQVNPHWSLGGIPPATFEKELKKMPLNERNHLIIYHDKDAYKRQNVRQMQMGFS